MNRFGKDSLSLCRRQSLFEKHWCCWLKREASCKLERLSNQAKDVEVSEEFSGDEDQRKNRERDLRVLTPDALS
jgi:hypothetical protein